MKALMVSLALIFLPMVTGRPNYYMYHGQILRNQGFEIFISNGTVRYSLIKAGEQLNPPATVFSSRTVAGESDAPAVMSPLLDFEDNVDLDDNVDAPGVMSPPADLDLDNDVDGDSTNEDFDWDRNQVEDVKDEDSEDDGNSMNEVSDDDEDFSIDVGENEDPGLTVDLDRAQVENEDEDEDKDEDEDEDDFGDRLSSGTCYSVSGKRCKFPFIYNGVEYNRCTYAGEREEPWCATEVTSLKLASKLSGCRVSPGCKTGCRPGTSWQFKCNTCTCTEKGTPSCTEKKCSDRIEPVPPPSINSCRVVDRSGNEVDCVFPFRYRGQRHSACTPWNYGGDNNGKYWCSTKTDSNDDHINGGGHFGFCDTSCFESYDDVDYAMDLWE